MVMCHDRHKSSCGCSYAGRAELGVSRADVMQWSGFIVNTAVNTCTPCSARQCCGVSGTHALVPKNIYTGQLMVIPTSACRLLASTVTFTCLVCSSILQLNVVDLSLYVVQLGCREPPLSWARGKCAQAV